MLDSKQEGRIVPWTSLIIIAFTIVSIFFIFLILRLPFPAQESTMFHINDDFRGGFIPNKEKGDDNTMELNMQRLVLEKNIAKFQAEGFTCQTEQHSEQCITTNHVRIQSNGDHQITIYIPSPSGSKTAIKTPQMINKTPRKINIKPYALRDDVTAMQMVTPLKILQGNLNHTTLPTCQYNHTVPVVLFSSGGYAVNTYHALDEFLIPLFLTTQHFNSNFQFFISDYDPRVIPKYRSFLTRLSKFKPIYPSHQNGTSTHCFPGAVIGLNKHGNVLVNSSDIPTGYTMADFRRFMYDSYNLNSSYLKIINPVSDKPVLILASRAKSRVILNEKQVVKLMEEVGYKVHVALDNELSNLDKFSRLLSKCSVLVGTHGAGLSNSVFMPQGTVLLQVVPLGLRGAGMFCHGDPAIRMGLRYIEYLIEPKESSLSDLYDSNDPVLVDPDSLILEKGYAVARGLYIDGQNVTINLNRFRDTLLEVLRVLRSPRRNTTEVLLHQN